MNSTPGQYHIQGSINYSKNSVLYRAVDSKTGESVILKTLNTETMSTKELAKLQNEYAALSKVKSEFVSEALDFVKIDESFFLVMKYYNGISLSEYIKKHPLEIKEFLFLAQAIIKGLIDIHNAGIIHKDLNPSNILYNAQTRKVTIVDFGISAEFSYEKPLMVDSSSSGGTLHYLSPEQTGRMNRAIDFRTDFYSLGITFYEMLCGEPPFHEKSPTELIYDHVAKIPPTVKTINPKVPETLSRIVAKLMEKMPEDRYHSAEGILFDIDRCIRTYDDEHGIPDFEPGLSDYSNFIEIPHKLYGRKDDAAVLEKAYNDILRGEKCTVFISGQSGVGKTSLVGSIQQFLIHSSGLLVSGKPDQYHRNIPHFALVQALGNFFDIILSENAQQIELWKMRIEKALGQDTGLIADKLPQLSLIIGKTQAPEKLSSVELGIRFLAAVQRLFIAIASPKQPIVIFIDDLHLAAPGALDVIEEIMSNEEIRGLLIILCYRDNEVDENHPLILSRNKMLDRKQDIRQLTLSGLSHAAVVQMLADTLHCEPEKIFDLAEVLYGKTHGNPFYIRQFLMICHRNGSIRFHKELRRWEWDIDTIRTYPAEQNVVDFLVQSIDQFSPQMVSLLSLGACSGRSFSCELLFLLSSLERSEIRTFLRQAAALEIIYPVRHDENTGGNALFQFSHDRFQQAFYSLLPEHKRKDIHHTLAQYYIKTQAASGDAELKFLIADHYLKAFDIIDLPEEKREVARMLLDTAHSANQLASYLPAVQYLESVIGNLNDIKPVEDSFLFEVYATYHFSLCKLARYDEADRIYPILEGLAHDPIELTDSCCLQAVGLSMRGFYQDGFLLSIGLLKMLGVDFPEDDLYQTTVSKIVDYYAELKRGNFIGINAASLTTDKKEAAIAKILNRTITAGFFYSLLYSSWMIITSALRTLEYGYTPESLLPYAELTLVLVSFKNDYRLSYTVANKARKIAEKSGFQNEVFRIYHVYSLFTIHWCEDVKSGIPYAREAMKGNASTGDFEFACYTYFTTQQAVLETCETLKELSAENKSALAYANKTGNRHAAESFVGYAQLYKALKGRTNSPGSFTDDEFDEQAHLATIRSNQMAQCYYYILRALCAAIYTDYDTVYELTEKAAPLLPLITGFYPVATHNFLYSLAICKRLENHDCGKAEKRSLLKTLRSNQKWLGERASEAPVNFLHFHSILNAEIAAVNGGLEELIVLYEKAIQEAADHNRPYHYALLCELASQRFFKLKAKRTAAGFLREAYSAYLSWGASGKVEQLKKNNSGLLSSNYIGKKELEQETVSIFRSSSDRSRPSIDFNALITASQTISGEIELESILDKLINVLLEMSGAQHIYYLTKDEADGYLIRAEGHSEGNIKNVDRKRHAQVDCISLRIVNYVDRTKDTVALDNASVSDIFMMDEHISLHGSKSVLCMPIINKGDLKGILYLENKLIEGVFDKKNLEALKIIASQLAISVENSYLYSNLQLLVDEKTRALREEIEIRQAAEKRLEYMANHDILTGLPNRRMFQKHLKQSMETAAYENTTIAVLFIDLDGFKAINDRYGHDKGDIILTVAAERLTNMVRGCDMVSRLGGDEFIIVIENVTGRECLERLCTRIINSLREPIILDDTGLTASVTSSIGISISGHDGSRAEELITHSDSAMYAAKKNGKDRYVFYSSENDG